MIESMAQLYKSFSDETRLKILFYLSKQERCVIEIAHELNMTHSAISHQLRVLKQSNLVSSTKKGKEVYYSLKDQHIFDLLKVGKEHVQEKYHDTV